MGDVRIYSGELWTPWYQRDQEVNVEKLINDLEQQYYEITDDDDWYRRWKENRVTRDTNESTEKLKKYHETSYTNLMTDLHNYNAQYTYLDKLGVLTSTYEELNEKMSEDKENNEKTI